MAFGGVTTCISAGKAADGFWKNRAQFAGLTLAGRVGAFAIAAADSGRLTTDQTPPANETAITPAAGAPVFGPGPGLWLAGDQLPVNVTILPSDDAALVGGANAASDVRCVAQAIAGSADLNLDFHNVGAGAFAGTIIVEWTPTIAH